VGAFLKANPEYNSKYEEYLTPKQPKLLDEKIKAFLSSNPESIPDLKSHEEVKKLKKGN